MTLGTFDARERLVRAGSSPAPGWERLADQVRQDGTALPFSFAEYAERLTNVRSAASQADAGAVVVFRPSTVEYLCGHHTVEVLPQPLVVLAKETRLYVPDAEVGRALASSNAARVVHYKASEDGLAILVDDLAGLLPSGARIALEKSQPGVPARAVEMLEAAGFVTVDGNHLVERLRLRLSGDELSFVRRAADITQAGFAAAVDAAAGKGATDSTIAASLLAALTHDANSVAAFSPVVATGTRAGIPHSTWANVPIKQGTTTFLEFSGAHHRYHAPVMRTLVHGDGPSTEIRRLFDLADAYVDGLLAGMRPGVVCADLARSVLRDLGDIGDDVIFHYNFGYPVGLGHPPTWMDGMPFYIVEQNEQPLEEGMVFHLPGSFRILGTGGVGRSQTVRVTASGAEVLTHGSGHPVSV